MNIPICLSSFARVPEHSLPLMTAMSGGKALYYEPYLFFSDQDWLMAIGYPLRGRYNKQTFNDALNMALKETRASVCFAIGTSLPPMLERFIIERDRFYILNINKGIPAGLRRYVRKAAENIDVTETTIFTAAHRHLWTEFLEERKKFMTDRVIQLYLQTPNAIKSANGSLRLLNAWDKQGNLVAVLLLDYYPDKFSSYIIGAHSRKHYSPHAVDLLFSQMIERAVSSGKRYIHLGLGVNDGILRFKLKWGARPYLPYMMAQWESGERQIVEQKQSIAYDLIYAFTRAGGTSSARQILASLPEQKPFAMLWRVEKKGRVSWIGGTAHFFYYSFEDSFKKLFQNVDNVLFEGPLDSDFMSRVDEVGKNLPPNIPPLLNFLNDKEVEKLEKVVLGSKNPFVNIFVPHSKSHLDIRWLLSSCNYWYAFFTLWTTFLERIGWRQSVDMEAWRIANELNKTVIGMETLEEQMDSLASVPLERVLNFFRNCENWSSLARQNLRSYLSGDLEKMMGTSAEFPTRTEFVIGRRDQRFRLRMHEYLEVGRSAVFVGSAHMINLRHMLVEDGFSITQTPFGIWPRLRLCLRNIFQKDDILHDK